MQADFIPKTIVQASQQMQSGLLTSTALVKYYLARIHNLNPLLNAFITILEQEALEAAAQLDFERSNGQERGLLHGIPVVIKDNIDTAGIKTTVGSQLFCDRIPLSDSAIVQKLKAAGVVILGKTNLNEFAAELSGNNLFYGNTCNVWNHKHSSGGSSSGSATAIASDLCLAGIGTDTGGSIRVPASWSGVVGLRPTFGLLSNQGVFPRVPSFDTVGLMANCVEDVAIVLDAVLFPISTNLKQLYPLPTNINGLKLGVISNYTFCGIEGEIAKAIYNTISILRELGAEIVTLDSRFLEEFDQVTYSTIALYEFSQALQVEYAVNPNVFGDKVQSDLSKGVKISRHHYKNAKQKCERWLPLGQKLFEQVDVVLTPTTPMVAPPINSDRKIYQLNQRFMLPFSFMGLPAISLPCGWSSQGLPIGLQIVSNSYDEALILRVALAFEIATAFSKGSPL
ncbi:amidase [Nostoc commune NIES-4072]|uniref:Amidase n=1 Tax=Nostoc commune NIES-4072 TaxID=2005467 RepID=A0A2R5FX26_NOSCO|nr:amidase [Nostoc commune]BBD70181.1 amidase [Nostoc commune HK-02]GBG22835.1 amidase [Nostoc commune NIES-4072]